MTTRSTAQKIWGVLTPAQRRTAVVLFGLMIVGMVLETLGIGLVIPAMALLTQSDVAEKYPALASILDPSGNKNQNTMVVNGMLALVGVYLIKNLFLGFLMWCRNNFRFGLIASLSQRLYTHYLRQPYIFHLQRNSALLIRNVITEVDIFTGSIIGSAMQLLAESLTLLGIIALIVTVEPIGAAIVAGTIGVASLVFYQISHPYIVRWGALRQHHSGLRFQHLQQGLGGVKDVKLLGRESDFLEQFRIHSKKYARVGGLQNTLLELPRLWLELLAIGGLAALVLTMVAQGKTFETVLPTLGMFAVAAFRLMPAVNRVLGALQSLKFGLPVIDILHAELATTPTPPPPFSSAPMHLRKGIVLEAVSFRYPSVEARALTCVSTVIPRGSTVGFIGESGAGKSTLVDILLGLLTPESGTVRVDGIDIQTNLRGWQDQIGYVPQSVFLTDDTLRRNVAFGLPNEQIDDAAVWRALRAAQLETFVNELPQGLDNVVGERGIRLSGGQRQRIGIARALYHDPSVLVLDEATSSLDTATEAGVMEAVHALHGTKTIIIVSHRFSTVERCDRLYRLEQGRVVEEGEVALVLGAATSKTK